MKPLHKELKDIRMGKGITLDEIYRVTKIRVLFLEKIEEGDFSVVPEPFMRAFLREYAEAVGIDPDRVISKYEGKAATIQDNESGKHGDKKSGGAVTLSSSDSEIPASSPSGERVPEISKPLHKDKKTSSAPIEEQSIPATQASPKIISGEPDPSVYSNPPYVSGHSLPDEEEKKSPRAIFFGIFAIIIVVATLVILYLNGIIAF